MKNAGWGESLDRKWGFCGRKVLPGGPVEDWTFGPGECLAPYRDNCGKPAGREVKQENRKQIWCHQCSQEEMDGQGFCSWLFSFSVIHPAPTAVLFVGTVGGDTVSLTTWILITSPVGSDCYRVSKSPWCPYSELFLTWGWSFWTPFHISQPIAISLMTAICLRRTGKITQYFCKRLSSLRIWGPRFSPCVSPSVRVEQESGLNHCLLSCLTMPIFLIEISK